MLVNEITMTFYQELVEGKDGQFVIENKHYNSFPEIIRCMNTAFYKLKNGGSVHIYSVSDDNVIILVAAVTLQTMKKQVIPVGAINYFDFADFLYNDRVEEKFQRDAFWSLLRFWAQKGFKTLYMKYLPQTSMTKKFIEEKYNTDFECVKNVSIPFGDDFQTYWKSLSKHTRQNLRTAENRLRTDRHVLHFLPPHIHFNNESKKWGDKNRIIINRCIDCYVQRQKQKYGQSMVAQFSFKSVNYTSKLMKSGFGILFVLEINNEIGAFLYGYHNESSHSLEVPRLAINGKYEFYSPGMLLLKYSIEWMTQNTNITQLDLCRGTEEYKIKMGGIIYPTWNGTIELAGL